MSTTNFYFNTLGHYGEQNLIEDLIVESIKIYGIDCYYMPRTIVNEDQLFGEDTLSKFEDAYPLEMYIKSVNGFEGDGTFLSKFGLEIRDEMVLSVAQRRFGEEISYDNTTKEAGRPVEGDLIFFPLNNKIYEVKFVEHEVVFYQMGKLQTYDLTCELFEYSSERIDTGIQVIDAIEDKYSIADQNERISLETYLSIGSAVALVADAIISSVLTNSGESQPEGYIPNIGIVPPQGTPVTANATVLLANSVTVPLHKIANTIPFGLLITESGFPYNSNGNYLANSAVVIENPAVGFGRFFSHSLNVTDSSYKFPRNTLEVRFANTVANTNSNIRFFVEEEHGYYSMWIYANSLPSSSENPAAIFRIGGGYGLDTGLARGEASQISTVHTKVICVDDQGRIVLNRRSGTQPIELLTTDSIISTNNWIHLTYAIENYNGSNYQRVFANGVLKYNETINSDYLGIACYSNTYFGSALETTHNRNLPSQIDLNKFDGFIDDIHVNSDTTTLYSASANPSFTTPTNPSNPNPTTLYLNRFSPVGHVYNLVANSETLSVDSVVTRTAGDGYSERNQFNTHISYNVTFPTANTRTATLSATMTDNVLSSIAVHQAGFGYLPDESPRINITPIEDPEGGRLIFEDGSTIQSENVRLENSDSSANNEYFAQQAGSDAYDVTFIDFTDQNPFSEGENW